MHAQNEYNLHACMQVAILHSSTARVASQHYLIQVALLNMANGSTTDFYNTIYSILKLSYKINRPSYKTVVTGCMCANILSLYFTIPLGTCKEG